MQTKSDFKKLSSTLLIALLFIIVNSDLLAQEKKSTDLKDFKIVVEKTDNGIKLTSTEGSAWVDLAFSIDDDLPQAIDEHGMTKTDKVSSEKDANLADFLFTITKTENGIILKGIEGTAWTDLSFSLTENRKQAIDQFGMTKLN